MSYFKRSTLPYSCSKCAGEKFYVRKRYYKDRVYDVRRCVACQSVSAKKWNGVPANSAARISKAKEYRTSLKNSVYAKLGEVCACCGESEREFLSIDHINNDGAAHRRELGPGRQASTGFYLWLIKNDCPRDRFQILCMNCNSAKKYGVCPHTRRPRLVSTECVGTL